MRRNATKIPQEKTISLEFGELPILRKGENASLPKLFLVRRAGFPAIFWSCRISDTFKLKVADMFPDFVGPAPKLTLVADDTLANREYYKELLQEKQSVSLETMCSLTRLPPLEEKKFCIK